MIKIKLPPNLLDRNDVMDLLRSEVAKAGSQQKWAQANGVSRVVICRVLGGHGTIQPKIIDALGLEKVEFYVKR